MKDFDMNAGIRIRTLREKQGFSREKLSEMSQIGSKFLYEIETGKKGMSAYTLYNIATALNVSTDYILTGKSYDGNISYIANMLSTIPKNKHTCIEKIINCLVDLLK